MTDLPAFEAGCRMPTFATIQAADTANKHAAAMGSDRLLIALLAYGMRHGLPNIDPAECRRRLDGFA